MELQSSRERSLDPNKKLSSSTPRSNSDSSVTHTNGYKSGEQKTSKGKKEKLFSKTPKGKKTVLRGSLESFSSKSGPESDFDLDESGYLDGNLFKSLNSGMSTPQTTPCKTNQSFRGLNYGIIGDTVYIPSETEGNIFNSLREEIQNLDQVKNDKGSSENRSSFIESENHSTSSSVTVDVKPKKAMHSLNYLQHRGSFPSDLHHINGDGISQLSHTLSRLSTGSSYQRSPRSTLLLHSSRSSSQRDLSTTSSLCSDDSNEETIDSETTRLTTVLDHIDPNRLHTYLVRQLKSKNKRTVLALSSLLPKKKFTAETIHCVRCHKEYDPKYGIQTCTLFHPESSVSKMFEDDEGADFACDSCGTVFRAEGVWDYSSKINKTIDCGFCYVGMHTYNTDEVDYHPNGIAKACEDNGCVVFYV